MVMMADLENAISKEGTCGKMVQKPTSRRETQERLVQTTTKRSVILSGSGDKKMKHTHPVSNSLADAAANIGGSNVAKSPPVSSLLTCVVEIDRSVLEDLQKRLGVLEKAHSMHTTLTTSRDSMQNEINEDSDEVIKVNGQRLGVLMGDMYTVRGQVSSMESCIDRLQTRCDIHRRNIGQIIGRGTTYDQSIDTDKSNGEDGTTFAAPKMVEHIHQHTDQV
jgi:hypothetical protein